MNYADMIMVLESHRSNREDKVLYVCDSKRILIRHKAFHPDLTNAIYRTTRQIANNGVVGLFYKDYKILH